MIKRTLTRQDASPVNVILMYTEILDMFDFVFRFRYNEEIDLIEWCHEDNEVWLPMTTDLFQIISDGFLEYKKILFPASEVQYFIKQYLRGPFIKYDDNDHDKIKEE